MTAHPLHLTIQKLTRTNSKGQRVTKYRAFVRGRDLAKPITRVWPTMSQAREWGRQYLGNPELAFQLDNAVFMAFVTEGAMSPTDFADFIDYDGGTGELAYDADGAGAADAVLFATIGTGQTITEDDFLIV